MLYNFYSDLQKKFHLVIAGEFLETLHDANFFFSKISKIIPRQEIVRFNSGNVFLNKMYEK